MFEKINTENTCILNKKLNEIYEMIKKEINIIDDIEINVGCIETDYFIYDERFEKKIKFLNKNEKKTERNLDALEKLVKDIDTEILLDDFNCLINEMNNKVKRKINVINEILIKGDYDG